MQVLLITEQQFNTVSNYCKNNGLNYFSDNPSIARDINGNYIIGWDKIKRFFPNIESHPIYTQVQNKLVDYSTVELPNIDDL